MHFPIKNKDIPIIELGVFCERPYRIKERRKTGSQGLSGMNCICANRVNPQVNYCPLIYIWYNSDSAAATQYLLF